MKNIVKSGIKKPSLDKYIDEFIKNSNFEFL